MWKIIILSVLSCAMASHFRGALFQWRPLNTETFDGRIIFFHRTAWRRGSCSAANSNTQLGPLGSLSVHNHGSISLLYYCTDFNIAENWEVRSNAMVIHISSSASYFEASFSSCCWISLSYRGNGGWGVITRGTLAPRPDNGRINTPPTTTITPIVRLQQGMTYNISIPHEDADGDHVRCRWATGNECGWICRGLPASVLNEMECVLTYTANTNGIFAVAIQIEDFIKANSTSPMSSTPVQFLISISHNNIITASEPQLIGDSPSNGSFFLVNVEGTFRTQLVAYSGGRDFSIVAFSTSSVMGLSISTVQHHVLNSTVYYVNVTWSPTPSQIGEEYMFCFSATNSIGLESSQSCIEVAAGTSTPLLVKTTPNVTENFTMAGLCLSLIDLEEEREIMVEIVLNYTSSRFATFDDFYLVDETLVFNSSEVGKTKCAYFMPFDDTRIEDTECFYFQAITENETDVLNNNDIQVCIYDNDGASIQLLPTSTNIFENMTTDLCLSLNSTLLEREVLVDIKFAENESSAYAGSSDFHSSNAALTFNATNARNKLCETFRVVDDNIPEMTEVFIFQLSTPNSMDSFVGDSFTFHLYIYDDDGTTIQLEHTSNTLLENSTIASHLCVQLSSSQLERQVIVDLIFSHGQSSPFSNFSDFELFNTSLIFTGDSVNETLCGIFQPVDDAIVEDNETFYFQLSTQNSLDTFQNGRSFQQHIVDNDGARIQLDSPTDIFENSTRTTEFCVNLQLLQLERQVVVDIVLDQSQSSENSKTSDFSISNTSLTFSTTSPNRTLCGVVIAIDDVIIENNEVFYFQLSPQNSLDYLLDGNSSFHLSIYDDDRARVTLLPATNIFENQTTPIDLLCVSLNSTHLERDVIVEIMFKESHSSTYARTSDFYSSNTALTFNATNSMTQLCEMFRVVDDNIPEMDELFVFQASTPNSMDFFVGDNSRFHLYIYDNDGMSIV